MCASGSGGGARPTRPQEGDSCGDPEKRRCECFVACVGVANRARFTPSVERFKSRHQVESVAAVKFWCNAQKLVRTTKTQ